MFQVLHSALAPLPLSSFSERLQCKHKVGDDMHNNCSFYLGVPFVLAILVRSITPSGCRQTQPGCPTIGVHCIPVCARTSHAVQLRKSNNVKTGGTPICMLYAFSFFSSSARSLVPRPHPPSFLARDYSARARAAPVMTQIARY